MSENSNEFNEFMNELEKLFEQEQFFTNITNSTADIDKLKETGNVTIVRQEGADGFVNEVINYVSFDGKVSFSKYISYPKDNEKHTQVTKLNELIQLAVENEDYEKAAKLKQEKENLLKGIE